MTDLDRLPLETLPTFLLAADLGSFSAAARHIGIGQPAVSRQIARLEQAVGTPLFRRTTSSIELTIAGRTMHDATQTALSLIADAANGMTTPAQHRVTIDVSASFATLWLLDHLDDFAAQVPDVDVRVTTRFENAAASTDADVLVYFSSAADSSRSGEVLVIPEHLIAIRAPGGSKNGNPPDPSAGLDLISDRPLLGLDLALHRDDWALLLGVQPTIDRWYSSYTVYLQAVVAGHGYGLGWKQLVQRHLDDGIIERVSDIEASTSRGYFARRTNPSRPHRAATALIEWLAAIG